MQFPDTTCFPGGASEVNFFLSRPPTRHVMLFSFLNSLVRILESGKSSAYVALENCNIQGAFKYYVNFIIYMNYLNILSLKD